MEERLQSLDTLIEVMAFLKKVPLFSELGIPQLGLIAQIAGEEEFADEAVLIQEGTRNQKLFILAKGVVEVSAQLSGDQQGSISIVRPPDCLGEDGIFSGHPSPVTAQVIMGKARAITMQGEELKRLIRLYPEIGIGLLAATSRRLQTLQRTMIRFEQ